MFQLEPTFWFQVSIMELQALDSSTYLVSPLPFKATVPRLAREMLIDRTNLLVRRNSTDGLIISMEFLSALALGFEGELGNFIVDSHSGDAVLSNPVM